MRPPAMFVLPPLFYIPSWRGRGQIHILPMDRSAVILVPWGLQHECILSNELEKSERKPS